MAGIASILKLRDNASFIRSCIEGGVWMKEIVDSNEDSICEMNSETQLYEKGTNAVGASIMDYQPYTNYTVYLKKQKGQPTNRVTLRDTGDFHKSFYIDSNNEGFTIDAKDWKRDELASKYGDEIFGLTDDNKDVLAREIIYPDLLKRTKEALYK